MSATVNDRAGPPNFVSRWCEPRKLTCGSLRHGPSIADRSVLPEYDVVCERITQHAQRVGREVEVRLSDRYLAQDPRLLTDSQPGWIVSGSPARVPVRSFRPPGGGLRDDLQKHPRRQCLPAATGHERSARPSPSRPMGRAARVDETGLGSRLRREGAPHRRRRDARPRGPRESGTQQDARAVDVNPMPDSRSGNGHPAAAHLGGPHPFGPSPQFARAGKGYLPPQVIGPLDRNTQVPWSHATTDVPPAGARPSAGPQRRQHRGVHGVLWGVHHGLRSARCHPGRHRRRGICGQHGLLFHRRESSADARTVRIAHRRVVKGSALQGPPGDCCASSRKPRQGVLAWLFDLGRGSHLLTRHRRLDTVE